MQNRMRRRMMLFYSVFCFILFLIFILLRFFIEEFVLVQTLMLGITLTAVAPSQLVHYILIITILIPPANAGISSQNGRLLRISGANPFIERTTAVATPMRSVFNRTNLKFTFPSNLFFTNKGKAISSIVVGFGNGTGPVTISPNQTLAPDLD